MISLAEKALHIPDTTDITPGSTTDAKLSSPVHGGECTTLNGEGNINQQENSK